MIDQITPLIITYNEAPNIQRVLAKLSWARRIVVVDSGSTDGTLEILGGFHQVEIIHRPFDNFANQCNFGLQQVHTPWVLSLDSDYELSDSLVSELNELRPGNFAGYRARFVYRIYGRSLRGTLYPPRIVLYQKRGAVYRNEGHGHRVQVEGEITDLRNVIFHDDRKPLMRWVSSQQRYARDEVAYLLALPKGQATGADKIRLMGWLAPILVVFYTLFAKGCIFDGWPGWHYTLQRLCAEVLMALELVDQRLSRARESSH